MKFAQRWVFKMGNIFEKAFVTGVERISAWVDLLDEINVYPIADGDTGRNLIISLSPLRQITDGRDKTKQAILLAARGNSGNIAARFFSGFLSATDTGMLSDAVKLGRKLAWEAVSEPVKGTMLSVFDALAEIIEQREIDSTFIPYVIEHLENAVHSTPNLLPRLKKANVVDAGALGMFIYFEGFFNSLADYGYKYKPIMKIFKDKLSVSSSFKEASGTGYCIDMVLKGDDKSTDEIRKIAQDDDAMQGMGAMRGMASAVIIKDKEYIKVHIHTDDRLNARNRFGNYGVVKWNDDDLGKQIQNFKTKKKKQSIHIMTDGAGSVTYKDVKDLGITLLDSYILSGHKCVPETHYNPEELYESMLNGIRASTSQASVFERHQHYESVLSRYERVLYLCVGSVYTGNYKTAMDWKNKHDPDNRMTVIDTGTASGRLGIIAIASARFARTASAPDDVVKFAEKAIGLCKEYIFLEKLHYLARGGRMSKTGAFFGDMLRVKPIVSPHADGVVKQGIARNNKDQFKFLFGMLERDLKQYSKPLIMLEYTNNFSWVNDVIKKKAEQKYPHSEIFVQPLSLTTGVHAGPGAWGVAYLDMDNVQ